jgi:hypothetical protein
MAVGSIIDHMPPYPLEEMAPHIAYEAERMRFIVAQADFMDPKSNRAGTLRESFLIHFRNLIDFLYEPRKFKTDAIAADYLDTAPWKPNVPPWLEEDKERCNKLLHHPTYDRVQYEKTGALKWKRDFREQAQHLLTDWNSFLSALPPGRATWFNTPQQKF